VILYEMLPVGFDAMAVTILKALKSSIEGVESAQQMNLPVFASAGRVPTPTTDR
jgi:hypothetical protein